MKWQGRVNQVKRRRGSVSQRIWKVGWRSEGLDREGGGRSSQGHARYGAYEVALGNIGEMLGMARGENRLGVTIPDSFCEYIGHQRWCFSKKRPPRPAGPVGVGGPASAVCRPSSRSQWTLT